MPSLVIGALLASTPAWSQERRYSVTDFDRIQIDGPYQVTLTTGQPSAAFASGSSDAIERVMIDVQGRTLRIRPNNSAWGGSGQRVKPVTVRLTTRDFRSGGVLGSGSLQVDKAQGARIDVTVSGSGRITLGTVQSDMLVVGVVGSGRVSAAGKAKIVRAVLQGSADFDGKALTGDDVDVNSDTSGTVAVAAVRTAKVLASGSGDVEIIGKPACSVIARGSGRILCGE